MQHARPAIPRTMEAVAVAWSRRLRATRSIATTCQCRRPAGDEVLVRVGGRALNNTDINTRVGWYSKAVNERDRVPSRRIAILPVDDGGWTGTPFVFPRIQGTDACGRIVAVGMQVNPARIGERVLVDPVLRSRDGTPAHTGFLGADRDGAFAEYVAVPAANAHAIDSELTRCRARASFPCAYSAAENMLERAAVSAGETVLVTGASGGVGSAAVQLARRRGARVIADARIRPRPPSSRPSAPSECSHERPT